MPLCAGHGCAADSYCLFIHTLRQALVQCDGSRAQWVTSGREEARSVTSSVARMAEVQH